MEKENLKITFVDVNSLKVAAYNPRKWDDAKKEKLKESIERFGLVDPIIVMEALLSGNCISDIDISLKFSLFPEVV